MRAVRGWGRLRENLFLASALMVQDVRVFDGARVWERVNVAVVDGRIAEVGPNVRAPKGAVVIDGRGKTLLPGLIDAHFHTLGPEALQAALTFGVTTVLDMFSLPGNKGKPGADLRTSGILATAPGGHGTEYGVPIPTLQRPEEAQAFVDARIADGADYIKIVLDDGSAFGFQRPTLNAATVRALVQAAHRRGKLAMVHIATKADARVALEAGADVLHHLFDGGPDEDLARMLGRKRAVLAPTLAALRTGCGAPGVALASDPRIAPYLSEEAANNLRFAPGGAKKAETCAEGLAALLQLKTTGVRILAGTDAPNPGTAAGASLHGEMELLVQAGMSPAEALAAATSEPAAVFRLTDRGRIAKGMRADLVLVDGNPTQHIRATRAIVEIWQQGVAVERKVY